jgi:hypothetical protein
MGWTSERWQQAIKFRNTESTGPHYFSEEGSVASLFNHDGVYRRAAQVLVVKGEISAMVLWERGFLACAPNAGEGASQRARDELRFAFFTGSVLLGEVHCGR